MLNYFGSRQVCKKINPNANKIPQNSFLSLLEAEIKNSSKARDLQVIKPLVAAFLIACKGSKGISI